MTPQPTRRILQDVLTFAVETGFGLRGLAKSPLRGPKGNVEFLAWLDLHPNRVEIPALIMQGMA